MVPKFEKRVRAYAADISGAAVATIIVAFGFPGLEQWVKMLIVFIAYFLTSIFPYFISKGQSFGKRIQKIKIVKIDGSDANLFILILRELFKTGLGIVTFGIYSIVAYFALTEKNVSRTIHDYVFKTKAIDLEKPTKHDRKDHMLGTSESLKKKGL